MRFAAKAVGATHHVVHHTHPGIFGVVGLGAVIGWCGYIIMSDCREASPGWPLRHNAISVAEVALIDLSLPIILFCSWRAGLQAFDYHGGIVTLGGIAFYPTGKIAGERVRRRGEDRPIRGRPMLRMNERAFDWSLAWVRTSVVPTACNDVEGFRTQACAFVGGRPQSDEALRIEDHRYVNQVLLDKKETVEMRITTVCTRLLVRGGHDMLRAFVGEQAVTDRARSIPTLAARKAHRQAVKIKDKVAAIGHGKSDA